MKRLINSNYLLIFVGVVEIVLAILSYILKMNISPINHIMLAMFVILNAVEKLSDSESNTDE